MKLPKLFTVVFVALIVVCAACPVNAEDNLNQWPAVKVGVRIVAPLPYPPGYVEQAKKEGVTLRTVTDIELIVDGDIVDLNRICLPDNTPDHRQAAVDGHG